MYDHPPLATGYCQRPRTRPVCRRCCRQMRTHRLWGPGPAQHNIVCTVHTEVDTEQQPRPMTAARQLIRGYMLGDCVRHLQHRTMRSWQRAGSPAWKSWLGACPCRPHSVSQAQTSPPQSPRRPVPPRAQPQHVRGQQQRASQRCLPTSSSTRPGRGRAT